MKERLNVMDLTVKRIIDEKYAVKKNNLTIESNKICERMVSTIDFYKNHSFEEVCVIKKNKLEKEFNEMSQDTALRNATILAFKNKGKLYVSDDVIKDVTSKITPDAATNIIANYKKIAFKEKLDKVLKDERKNYEFFGRIPDEEKIRFSSLYQEMILSEDLLKAREASISETAKELEKDLPLCLENKDIVSSEGLRIFSINEADDNEKAFITKVKEACAKTAGILEEQERGIALSMGVSVTAGACAFVGHINNSLQLNPAITSAVLLSSFTMATCMALYNSYDIKCFFENKKTLFEAKELGLIDLLVNWGNATKTYSVESEKYKSDFIRQMEGGKNGLH